MPNSFHFGILSPEQINILGFIENINNDFLLVGGTAIALHIGHRQSIDFDFFSDREFDIDLLKNTLRKSIGFDKILIDKVNEFTFISHDVKLTYLYYPFTISTETNQADYHLYIPSLDTLLAMKIYALSRRSKWKDYVDIYFGLKYISLDDIITKAKDIFGNEFNEKIIRTQLAYFKDIDYTEEVIYIAGNEVSEEEIQDYLINISLT
jgi:predicted nucleotidyltransferase component of viral defense system